MIFGYSRYIKKYCAPRVFKTFLLARNTESLAGKSRTQNIMRRYILCVNFCNIAYRSIPEISLIDHLGVFIPIRTKNAFASKRLKGNPESADTSEQIYESEVFGKFTL